jgi:hypothetical protein
VSSPQSLIDKIKALPPERLDEVEDFVDFISSRVQERSLALLLRQAQPFSTRSGAIPKTTSMMSFEFGDVILVPFPFTNQAASKKRSAVVVSTHAYNTARLDVVVMAIVRASRLRTRHIFGSVQVPGCAVCA